MLTVLGSVAQFKREMMLERQRGKMDFFNARRIINIADKASEIAELAKKWFYYLKETRSNLD